MPANPGNRLKIIHSNNSPDYSLSNTPTSKQANAPESADSEMAEVKSRMAAILDRMKSRADEISSNEPQDLQHGLEQLLSGEPSAESARYFREAELLKAEAEAQTRTAERALSEIEMRAEIAEASALEAEARAKAAEQVVHEIEQMVYESDAIATELQKKYKAAEARVMVERGLRLYAEKQLSSLAAEIETTPELETQDYNIEVSLATPQERRMLAYEDPYPQLVAQLESEKQTTMRAEQARDEAINRINSTQSALESAKDKIIKVEAYYEDVLRKHQIELRELKHEMAEVVKAATEAAPRPEPRSHFMPARSEEQSGSLSDETRRIIVQMMAYSSAAIVLLVILVALSIAIYNQF